MTSSNPIQTSFDANGSIVVTIPVTPQMMAEARLSASGKSVTLAHGRTNLPHTVANEVTVATTLSIPVKHLDAAYLAGAQERRDTKAAETAAKQGAIKAKDDEIASLKAQLAAKK